MLTRASLDSNILSNQFNMKLTVLLPLKSTELILQYITEHVVSVAFHSAPLEP